MRHRPSHTTFFQSGIIKLSVNFQNAAKVIRLLSIRIKSIFIIASHSTPSALAFSRIIISSVDDLLIPDLWASRARSLRASLDKVMLVFRFSCPLVFIPILYHKNTINTNHMAYFVFKSINLNLWPPLT